MGVQKNNRRTWQEYKYIRIPDRRLISGLLYINIVNHNQNDDEDDLIQQCNDASTISDGIKYSDAFVTGTGGGGSFDGFQDRGRKQMRHSFADYDCFVFHVAGGMTLHDTGISTPIAAGTTEYNTLAALQNNGFVTSSSKWEDSGAALGSGDATVSWRMVNDDSGTNPWGDNCSHFIKYHLLSRINNASGHGLNAANVPHFYKSRPIHTKLYRSAGGVVNLADPAVIQNDYILSHGVYDDRDTLDDLLTMEAYAQPGYGKTNSGQLNNNFQRIENEITGSSVTGRTSGETQEQDGSIADETEDGNTYYSPVDSIKIYGKHRLVFESHSNDELPESNNYRRIWTYQSVIGDHVVTWWDLVIEIGLRGNNPDGSTNAQTTDPDKAILRPQINISFQPFGETADFDISDTPHST